LHGRPRRLIELHRIVEEHQHPVAGELRDRAVVFEDHRPGCMVKLSKDIHHFFGLCQFGEGREAAQVAEEHGDFAPMARQHSLPV